MPRPIWNGSIAFGLVNVPVKVFTATSQQDVRFHQLRRSDGSRIRQKRVSAADGTEVPFEEIVKGYEISPDQYVVVEPDELAALDPKATQTIDIEEFVSLDQIDPIFYEHAYYLVPDKRAEKAYALLAAAMEETGKVAIAKFVMRTKQYLAAVRPAGRVLVLSTMLYADEVVPVEALEGLPDPEEIGLSKRELEMAESLIESLTAETFEPERFHDTYRQRVIELIEAKAAGETLVAAPAADTSARGRRPDGRARGQREGGQGAACGRRGGARASGRPRGEGDEGPGREGPGRESTREEDGSSEGPGREDPSRGRQGRAGDGPPGSP